MVYNLLNVFLNLVFKNLMVNFCVSVHQRGRSVVFFFAVVFLSICVQLALLSEFGSVLSFLSHRRVCEVFFEALVVLTMNPLVLVLVGRPFITASILLLRTCLSC